MDGRDPGLANLLALTEGHRETEAAYPEQDMAIAVQAVASELTLGPVLFNWQPERWRDFYFRIADEAPVATVYLGEAVCSKRAPLFDELFRSGGRAAGGGRQDGRAARRWPR